MTKRCFAGQNLICGKLVTLPIPLLPAIEWSPEWRENIKKDTETTKTKTKTKTTTTTKTVSYLSANEWSLDRG